MARWWFSGFTTRLTAAAAPTCSRQREREGDALPAHAVMLPTAVAAHSTALPFPPPPACHVFVCQQQFMLVCLSSSSPRAACLPACLPPLIDPELTVSRVGGRSQGRKGRGKEGPRGGMGPIGRDLMIISTAGPVTDTR